MSPSVSGRASIMLTADTSRLGFWIMSWASVMYSAKVDSLSPSDAEVREDLVPHELEHLLGGQVLEVRPAEILLLLAELPVMELARARGTFLGPRLGDVEQPGEHQERDLLDDRERVGDAPGPELGPELVDLVAQRSGDHATAVPALGGWNDSMILMMRVGLLFVGEQAVDAVGVQRRERRLVEPGDLDRPVLGDVVLEQVQEPDLSRVQRRVLLDEGREPLVDRRGIQADDAADRLVEMAGTVGVVVDQVVQVEHRVLGQHERRQRLQVGLADRLAALDPLERLVGLEQVLAAPSRPGCGRPRAASLRAGRRAACARPGHGSSVDVDDLGRQRGQTARSAGTASPGAAAAASPPSLATSTPAQKSAVRTSAMVGATALTCARFIRRSSSSLDDLGLQIVEPARLLQVFGLQAADEQVEAVGRLAAADVAPLHERGDLGQERGLGRRVELVEQVRVLERLDLLPFLLDGDGAAGQVGDVLGDQADGRLERRGVGVLERGLGQLDAGLEEQLGSDLACCGSAAW